MTFKRLLLAFVFVVAVAPAWAAAQGQYPSGVPKPPGPSTGPQSAATRGPSRGGGSAGLGLSYYSTRAFTGEIIEVNLTRGIIVVANAGQGRRAFYVGKKTRLRADKKSELGGRKRLLLEDFHRGLVVKVTYWPENEEATEIKAPRRKG